MMMKRLILVTLLSYSADWGVGGSLLSICTEFLSDCSQRVMVDGAVSEWITLISGMIQGSVLGHLLFIQYEQNV